MGGQQRAPALLDGEHAAFIQGGVSVIVASRDVALLPDVVRGCGCRVARDRRSVTVLVEPGRADRLVDAIRSTGTIAVVFSRPSTHRTIQLKGDDARLVDVTAADRRVAERHRQEWVADLVSVGYTTELAGLIHGRAEQGLLAISFTPTSAFDQTPGPAAGSHLKPGA